MARFVAPLFVLFLVACTSGTGGVQTGLDTAASTEDFDVLIEQTNQPLVMRGQPTVDIRFAITIRNRTDKPWTIARISLQSMGGGNYSMPIRSREYERLLGPGEESEFEFWGTVDVADDQGTARAPITIRTTLVARNDGQTRRERFLQRINGRVAVSIRDSRN